MRPITEEALIAYLARQMPDWRDIRIEGFHRVPMGSSRETFRFDLAYVDAGGAHSDRIILRRDPAASNVQSDRFHEYQAYRAIYGHGVPVPRMILLENDPAVFDGKISLAEDLRGYHNSEYQIQEPAWRDRLPHIARQLWSTMGRLAAVPVEKMDLSFMRPATREKTALQELDYWVDIIDNHDVEADPILRAAIRALRQWQPVAEKLALVHGDFRAGNFLYNDAGDLIAVLDWEMAHIGDPLEDLAWSMARVFSFGKDDRRSGLAPRDEAIRIWQESSGLAVDHKAMQWWELFSCVKGQAIWNSCASIWVEGSNRDIIHAYAAWWLRNAQNRAMLELMDRL